MEVFLFGFQIFVDRYKYNLKQTVFYQFNVLLFCLSLVLSEVVWTESINDDTTIIYRNNVSVPSRTGWSFSEQNSQALVLHSSFHSEKLVLSNLDYQNDTNDHVVNIQFVSSPPNLKSFQLKFWNDDVAQLNASNFNTNFQLSIGCFNNEVGCVSTTTTKTSGYWNVIYTNTNSFTVFGSNVSQRIKIIFDYIIDDTFSYPYIYIDGISNQKIAFQLKDLTYEEVIPYSNTYYLFTIPTKHNNFSTYVQNDVTSNLTAGSVCSRNDVNRYVLFKEDQAIYTNCSCWIRDIVTELNKSTIFNYPDCNYNSSLFDLILSSNSSIYSLSDDLLEWYSIIFTNSNQSIQINDRKTLIIDELDINQNNISFNENVFVKNLTISSPGAFFNVLNFDNIDYSNIEKDEIIFMIESTSTNLESFGLKQCEESVMKLLSTYSICNYENGKYINENGEIKSQCETTKLTPCNDLIIHSNEYLITLNEYWNILEISEEELIINGVSTLTSNICEFENKTATINCNLYCKTMNINSNTKLIVNGELIIDILVINDLMNDNLNENGIIESYDSIEITSIEITETQTNCFELISSNDSLSQPSINSDYLTLLLSQNHLLRICPTLNTNYEVQCTTIGKTFELKSYDLLNYSCTDENCIVNVTKTQLDTRNIEFNGTFNILTNATIAISYKTTSFTIQYENDKQILLIENGAVGFNISNTNSLESGTTTLSIHSSNQLPCKALLMEYNNQQCIIEDNTTYPQVGDIDNCQLQNGFGCETCYEGYKSNVTYCKECSSNCLRCDNGECINCEMNYQLNETNQCELISNNLIEIFDNNKIMKCKDGYYSNTNQCIKCLDSNCIRCNSSQCLTCNNSIILNNGSCQIIESNNGEEIISNYGVIDCNDGYYSNNSQCIDCSLTFDNCELCNINGCFSCSNGVIINNGSCSLNTNCLNIDDSICLSCNDKGSWFNGNACIECGDNCKNCINGYCIECNNGYILQNDNNCTFNEYPDNCITLSYYGTCQRCSDGYYLNNNLCYECSNMCAKCYNSTYCFECNDGYMLNDNNECVDISEVSANCKTVIPASSGGCAICNDGYYRDQTTCYSCISNCNKCNNDKSCLTCESNYFLLNDASKCISYDDLTNCETKTQSGCTKCNSSYYLNNQYCISCSNTTENCNTCNNNGECLTCRNDYVLINYECIHYQLIDNCKESNDSKCSSCSFWHTLNEDQTGCDTQVVWWVIVLFILFILIILIGICVLGLYVIKLILDWRKQQKQRKQTTIFDMKTSNIQFKSTNNKDVVINKNEILFNDESEEIGVNKETRDLICVGNTSKNTIKVQFSVKDGCDKYEIRTNPQLITIPKGKAVEFEIYIKPLCTCKINDQIMLISVDLSKGKTITTPITINTITIMTTILDYSELIENIKLGEGSFGIVYKGTFRGNQVAIKKLKNANDNPESIEEFNKEVSMLDKFRNDYIVHFYGAVFIPNKICMVTEFAQYGSLQDLMNKTKENPIDYSMKNKLLLDCSKGIQYLHSNGILHRDIKPDNFLVLSLDIDEKVNAKLTDFGSSRNVNMLMTNMTFTSGIGTPVYMAPEVLQQNKYKKSADIYSFAITIYETMLWNEAYPQSKFKFPWKIAEFVTKGERLPKPDEMNETMYSLITNSWKQEPKERYEIEDVIKILEELN